MRSQYCKAVRTGSASQSKRGELDPPINQAPAPGTWCNSKDIRSPWVDLSIRVSGVRVAQAGHVNLSACTAAYSLMFRRHCVSAADTPESWVSLNSDRRLLQREVVLLLQAKKGTEVETAMYHKSLRTEMDLLSDGDLDISRDSS